MGIIVGIIASIVTIVLLGASYLKKEHIELFGEYISYEHLTENNIGDSEPELRAEYYFRDVIINDLWRVQLKFTNNHRFSR